MRILSNRKLVGTLIGTVTGMFLIFAFTSACAANRHVVRVDTQLQSMNNSIALREKTMERDFDTMTQLLRHNATVWEGARKTAEGMRQTAGTSEGQLQSFALVRQVDRLRRSAKEMNETMAQMEARVTAMNEFHEHVQRSLVSPPIARNEPSK